jgi:putative transposase
VKYAFIEQHRHELPVNLMCRGLGICRSRFYAYRKEPASLHSRTDIVLREHIVRITAKHRGTPGALKTYRLLKAEGIACGIHRTARLRKLEGIRTNRTKKYCVMPSAENAQAPAPDLVKREFQVSAPNKVWVGDMTCIRTREGWLHLAMVLDLFARRIVGWAVAHAQDVSLPSAAMQMAINQRKPKEGLIFHSDQGSVYGSHSYRTQLASHGIKASMSRRGNCHDNAVAESFFSNLKNEVIHGRTFAKREDAQAVVADYIEVYYNRLRLHQSLNYQTPMQVESKLNVPY